MRSAVTWGHTTGQTWAWSKKFYRCTNFSFYDAIIKVTCCWNNSLLIHAEGLIYQMICVQVHVNYSIFIVDCVRLAQWDKIVFFFDTWDLETDLWSHQLLSVLSAVIVKLTWHTVVIVKHGFGWKTEVYVLLSVEEQSDVSKIFHLHL